MFKALSNIPAEYGADCAIEARPEPTMLEQLNNKRILAETKLNEINAAISALTANPEIEKVLTAIGRTLRY